MLVFKDVGKIVATIYTRKVFKGGGVQWGSGEIVWKNGIVIVW